MNYSTGSRSFISLSKLNVIMVFVPKVNHSVNGMIPSGTLFVASDSRVGLEQLHNRANPNEIIVNFFII